MEPSKLIIHLAKHVSKSFLFFGAKKKVKVYQPKVKKGKNVSMGFLSNFRSDIIRLLDQCCTRPVVFFLGEIWQKFRPEKYDFNLYKGFSIHKANMPTTTILCKKNKGCVTLWPCHLH